MGAFDSVTVRAKIDSAAERIGRVWPLYSDVGANPLSGFEDRPFHRAVTEAEALFDGRGYPTPEQFRTAWEDGRIDPEILRAVLDAHGITDDPQTLLDRMASTTESRGREYDETLNRLLAKWLAAFLDQGQATWPMPNRERGFYESWRAVAPYDTEVPASVTPVASRYHERLDDLPETASEAVYAVLSDYSEAEWDAIFEYHLAALPGWVGFIKQRMDDEVNLWQEQHPVTLLDYVAVRLVLAKHLDTPIKPDAMAVDTRTDDPVLAELWLTAWERSYRQTLVDEIQQAMPVSADETPDPDAQLVFCIDTRSEIIRRHLERTGPYETYGYGGFFGIPMEYQPYDSKTRTESCPVMVDPTHRITERPRTDRRDDATAYDRWSRLSRSGTKLLKSLKNDVAAAFGFVEASGGLFGAALASRTLLPAGVRTLRERLTPPRPASFCTPTADAADTDRDGMSTDRKVFYAEAAFDLMGWTEFAPVVVITGHQSQTANNPYESSIDCGACAGSPGTPNARTLASICNDSEVRARLRESGIDIPSETVFIPAEHNTTSDDVTLFTDGVDLSETHRAVIRRLRDNLDSAQAAATEERLRTMGVDDVADSVRAAETRTADWAQPRPEIGLSGNAGFVIGPRRLTDAVDLDGRCFLHSYDWTTDPDGDALENIMSGPMIVCQMISAQYYFSTVDNEVYGSGSKTTHNAVGNLGVVQGNGGDLLMGLPFQSLYDDDATPYHAPLRLSVVIHAPIQRVTAILADDERLAGLFDNDWLALTVLDPEQQGRAFQYQEDLDWAPTPVPSDESSTPTTGGERSVSSPGNV
ncbi:DUF2309 domain-containing protein [Haloplanus halobius]|uniref:DUF2309 domain-containing protein n=1 Tax=Haloplanus halobius TaxID=2934938 RepID=UPI00200D1245|nr:DUF2309 domain-containing protein [Haloplanus sp. XH21]